MKAFLRRHWEPRTRPERAAIFSLVVILCAASYLWLVQTANNARSQLKVSVSSLQSQSARLEQQSAEYERLRHAPASTVSPTDLRALVQVQADAAGLSRALTRIDAVDANQVKVTFDEVPFANWLVWLARLQTQQVRLDTSRIEALATPGVVKITATFVRPALR